MRLSGHAGWFAVITRLVALGCYVLSCQSPDVLHLVSSPVLHPSINPWFTNHLHTACCSYVPSPTHSLNCVPLLFPLSPLLYISINQMHSCSAAPGSSQMLLN